jgi:hypothetical protein
MSPRDAKGKHAVRNCAEAYIIVPLFACFTTIFTASLKD